MLKQQFSNKNGSEKIKKRSKSRSRSRSRRKKRDDNSRNVRDRPRDRPRDRSRDKSHHKKSRSRSHKESKIINHNFYQKNESRNLLNLLLFLYVKKKKNLLKIQNIGVKIDLQKQN